MTSRPRHYDDFALRLEPARAGGYLARIFHSIAGGGSVPFELPVDPAELDGLMEHIEARVLESAEDRRRASEEPREHGDDAPGPPSLDPEELGRALHRAVLGGRVGEAWAYHLGSLDREGAPGLRLRLVFDESEPGDAPLAALPWELLHQDRARGYLARNRRTPVVRHLDVEQPTVLPPIEPPLRVLLVAASTFWSPPLQVDEEEARIRSAWVGNGRAEIELVRETTLERLRERLLRGGFHVLHFMGHGEFVEGEDGRAEGALVFDDPTGRPRRVPASLLAESLRGLTDLRLVVLNACDAARFPRRRGVDPYSGVAAALVLAGLPAVVAMQFPISNRAAVAFGGGLYRALAAGDPVDAAVAEGRFAIAQDAPDSLEWATPALFSRIASGAVLEGLGGAIDRTALRERVLDFSGFVEEWSREFVGRQWLFEEIETLRKEKGRGYYQVVAEPGVGKSAIIAELVRRHGWVHHFNRLRANVVRPEAFLANVCAQLILAHDLDVPDLPPEATRDNNYFVRILGEV
ncbi:MAG: CHAT domain-containing protein, partial [Acidobacteriota bacterium]